MKPCPAVGHVSASGDPGPRYSAGGKKRVIQCKNPMALPFDLRSINRTSLFPSARTMDDDLRKARTASPGKAHHLCVFVHGLWGNTTHLNFVAQSLQDKYKDDGLIVYSAKRNTGSLTYDGVEIGAERVAKEIEDTIEELEREGITVSRFSIVGYSLGGLVARYTIGLLYHKGYFERMQPVNFTTFATPHLGVRTPLRGYQNHLWNVLGARTLSAAGRQLFTIDNFRQTTRPLLGVLADSDSIFIHALKQFQNRSLYTNIVNDRSVVYYTSGISRTDPYTDISNLKLNYVKGYNDVILDPDRPFDRAPQEELPTFYTRVKSSGNTFLKRAPMVTALIVLIPVATCLFLANACFQTFRSRRRILLHEQDSDGHDFGAYRIPHMVRDMRAGIEDAFENVNAAQKYEYLPEGSEEMAGPPSPTLSRQDTVDSLTSEKAERPPEFPTLALTSEQFAMVQSLDNVGWRKYPVHIHTSSHSHAAIVVRHPRAAFDDGKMVIKHWLERDFNL